MKGIFEGSFDRRTVRTAPAHVQGARLKAGAPLSWYRGYQRPDAGSIARALCAALLLLAALSPAAHAACSSPTGAAGDQIYNSTHNVMQYCNGTNWIAMGADGAGGGPDTLGDLTCNSGESIEFDGTDWQCVGGKVSRAGDTLTGPLAGTTASFTGVVSGALPTANGHLATKEYVDTAIAGAAGGGQYAISCAGAGASSSYICVRMNTETGIMECMQTGNGGSSWTSCSAPLPGAVGGSGVDPDGITDGGFFVLTAANWFGNLGGLAGADAKCLTELQSHPWKGKGSAGTLTSARVKAFLCDGTTCNNAEPYTRYSFATSRDTSAGGASFITNESGVGPNDSANWSNANYFATSVYFFSNRDNGSASLWATSPEVGGSTSSNCMNWTSSTAGHTFLRAYTAGGGNGRWNDSNNTSACTGNFPLVCFVHPEP